MVWTRRCFNMLADRILDPCVVYTWRTIPIVLSDSNGWSPGTALDWMLNPGSRKVQLWPGKSTKWADSSHSTQRTPHSCTFIHCQGRRQSERGRGEREAEWGTVGGFRTGPVSKTKRVVFFTKTEEKKRPHLGHQILFWGCGQSHKIPQLFSLRNWERLCQITIKAGRWWCVQAPVGTINAVSLVSIPQRKYFCQRLLDLYPHSLSFTHFLIVFPLKWTRTHFTSSCDSLGVAAGHKEEKSWSDTTVSSQEDGQRCRLTDE